MEPAQTVIPQLTHVFRISSIAGFIAAVTLIINLNFVAFRKVFKKRTRTYWWLFLVFMLAPLFLFLYIFNLFFGR